MAILTISRQFGGGAKAIALQVASELGYEYIDRATMFKDISAQGPRWGTYAKDFDEHYPNVWERNDWSFKAFVALIQNLIYEYAQRDKVIIAGTGATFLLKGVPHVLRVRIESSMEDRINRVQGDQVINEHTAKWIIEKVDTDMSRSMYILYGKHWDDPNEFDKVFNTSNQDQQYIVEEIKKGPGTEGTPERSGSFEYSRSEGPRSKGESCHTYEPGFYGIVSRCCAGGRRDAEIRPQGPRFRV